MRKLFMMLLLGSATCFSQVVLAENTYALVIGIDKYPNYSGGELLGAVNDANDISDTLQKLGVYRVEKLLNQQANHATIKKTWFELVDQAKRGDHLILTYAGHGSQIQDQNGDEKKRNAADSSDETFLLHGYGATKEQYQQQIVDDELAVWFEKALNKGIKVLFIADSCHSGESWRSINAGGKSRNMPPINMENPPPLRNRPEAPVEEMDNSGNYMFISGSKDSETVKEIIDHRTGKYRGALSMAFTSALYNADQNNDGGISIDEIKNYIETDTLINTVKNQEPTFFPDTGSNIIFKAVKKLTIPTASTSRVDLVKLKIDGHKPNFLNNLAQIKLVDKAYDLLWQPNTGNVFNSTGDLVASNIQGQDALGRLADRKRLVNKIYTISNGKGRFVAGKLGDTENKTHALNTKIKFSLDGFEFPYLYQFNLAGNGTIQCFKAGKTLSQVRYNFDTAEPVGNDTLVSIAVKKPIAQLDKLIGSTRHCTSSPKTLLEQLPKVLQDTSYQINHVDIFVKG